MCFAYQIINLSRTKQYNSCSDPLDSLCISVNNQLTVLQRELFFLCLNSLPGGIVMCDTCCCGHRRTHVDNNITRVWLTKCCKIQQLTNLYSTTYIHVQRNIFIINILYLHSTIKSEKREKSALLWRTTTCFILKIVTSGDMPRVTTRVYARKCS